MVIAVTQAAAHQEETCSIVIITAAGKPISSNWKWFGMTGVSIGRAFGASVWWGLSCVIWLRLPEISLQQQRLYNLIWMCQLAFVIFI